MRVLIDADACPSINLITDCVKKNKLELLLYTDDSHNIINDYGIVKTVEKGFQSVDIVIINEIKEKDILITQDYGLALLALSKKSFVIHPKGMIYTNDNIEQLLYEKYLNEKTRKSTKHIKGPRKRTKDDDLKLIDNLEYLINKLQ